MQTMTTERTYSFVEIAVDELSVLDLRSEAAQNAGETMQAFRISIHDEASTADVLYIPEFGRMGIAWGADATWADVSDVESGIDMWVNDGEAWEAAN